MAADTGQYVNEFTAAISKDGLVSELQVKRANGSVAHLQFPTETAGAVMMGMEQAIATLFEAQRKMIGGKDPRTYFPMAAKRIAKFQAAAATDGTPIMSLILDSGLRLDFVVPQAVIHDLIEWLQRLEVASRMRPAAQE
jgi:hypothetical protein